MKDYKKLREICLEEVKAAGIVPGNIVEWKINTRAKCRWGQCTINKRTGECIIDISYQLLNDERVSEKSCKETIIHEILHTCKGVKGHTGLWKRYAEIMNSKYGYNIKRVSSHEEKGLEEHISKSLPYRYMFECKYCGQKINKKKKCKFTKYYRLYGCGRCGRSRAFVKIWEKKD